MVMQASDEDELLRTPLHGLHADLGAKLVPFAGYDMPLQYEGVVAEHLHTRTAAGLFDVSHMGVIELRGDTQHVAEALETVMPSAFTTLRPGRQRYSFLTNEQGGIIDDLMVANTAAGFVAVVNASRKAVDLAHLEAEIGDRVEIAPRNDIALVAVQGPAAMEVVADLGVGAVRAMNFMDVAEVAIAGVTCSISRSGYTGEDGCEITIPAEAAEQIARLLLTDQRVSPVGLGARDTLRLEAGLCLYGNDLAVDISPVEADLRWAMQKRRRQNGGFIGDTAILDQLANGVERTRVGIRAKGRRPVRDGATLRTSSDEDAGFVSSGGFGPSVDGPVAMAYVPPALSDVGTELIADVRGKDVAVAVSTLPFSPHRYHRKES